MHAFNPNLTRAGRLLFACSALVLIESEAAAEITHQIAELFSPTDPEQGFAIVISNTGTAISLLARTQLESNQTRIVVNGGPVEVVDDFIATDLNAGGMAVGHISNGAIAAVYSAGILQEIGTLSGGYSYATAVNNLGQVVGLSAQVEGAFRARAFSYSDGVMRDLGTFEGDDSSYAADINDSSEIVGYSSRGDINRAFFYRNGQMLGIGEFGPEQSSFANAINNLGEIVGAFDFDNGRYRAFLLTDGYLRDLGVLPGFQMSTALSINNHSQVIGTLTTRDDELADNYVFRQVPFIYSSGVMEDLNALIDPESGWQLEEATDINDLGQIIGHGLLDGRRSTFVMTPIPEPATSGLAVVAALLLLGIRRRGLEI